jgi:choline dehydrogenase
VFDYVIVGAGSAGCVLAARLSESGEHTVLLIEAGPPDTSPWIHLPTGIQHALADERIEWRMKTAAEPHLAGRQVPIPRGRTLGGSSAMNGMVYIRGQAQDYDQWRDLGNAGWGYQDVLPWFIKSETNSLGAGAFHGADGPLKVSSFSKHKPLSQAFLQAAQACGIGANKDFNGEQQEGVGMYQHTIANGRRQSASVAYLRPALQRKNLTVWTNTLVQAIQVKEGAAYGVTVLRSGKLVSVAASKEVILAAGAIHSPALLQASGIGPGALLQSLGIEVVKALPGVGENLQDHLQARLRYRASQPITLNDLANSPWRKMKAGLQYALGRHGVLAEPPIKAGAFVKSHPSALTPDLQFHLIEFSLDPQAGGGYIPPPHRYPGFYSSVCFTRPHSRGSVRITSQSTATGLSIQPNFLSDARDCQALLAGVAWARKIAAQSAMANVIAEELEPGPANTADDTVLDWIRATAVTVYHPVGTCKMGNDAMSVVDAQLRVHGIARLRVVDGSIMPTLVSGNTNAPIMMIAEKAAHMILADA